eukprot:TRINITY_DN6405_c0_g2_i2.p2 TRINITY_DN6405_c0_g2~~TRINITY_DN6405_c0_g2_i2.p2  ORF type:complete len:154 (-),score=13.00 TRINITY_DN6405_c0_g2_i2:174-635(-)
MHLTQLSLLFSFICTSTPSCGSGIRILHLQGGQAFDEVGRRRPPSDGRERERLLLRERAADLTDQLGEAERSPPRRDPVGCAGDEGQPVRRRSPDDNAVDGVLEPPDPEYLDLAVGFEINLDQELRRLRFPGSVGSVAEIQEARGRRKMQRFG